MEKLNVKCDVQEGMFFSENFVTIKTGYETIQSLVSKELIINDSIQLSIDDETATDFFIIIPGEITKGNRVVKFRKPNLEV